MPRLQRTVKNFLHFFSAQGVNFTLGLLSSVILARTLGPNDLGIFHQVQWFAGTVSVLLSFGFITSLIRFTARYRAQGKPEIAVAVLRYIFLWEFCLAGITSLVLIVFSRYIADYYFSPAQSFLFTLSFLAMTPGMQTAVFSASLEGAQIFRYQSIHSITVTPLSLVIKISLLIMGYGIESLLWSNLAFSIVNLIYYAFAARREGLLKNIFRNKTQKEQWKGELHQYNRTSSAITLVDIIVWSRSENYFLGRYCAAAQIAYYNLAQNLIAKFFGMISSAVWKVMLPAISAEQGNEDFQKTRLIYRCSIRYIALVVFPMATICLMCAYELVVIFFGQNYAEVKSSFQVLCLGTLLSSLAQPGSAAIYAGNKQGFILWYGSALAIINIIMNFLLIPRYGALGASICYTTVTSIGVIGGFVFLRRKMSLSPPLLSLLKISICCLALAIILFWSLRQSTDLFRFFHNFQNILGYYTGRRWESIFGARTWRLIFSLISGATFYCIMVLAIFRPSEEDMRILQLFSKYLPPGILEYFARKKVVNRSE